MNNSDEYTYLATCNNCHATEEFSIPRGTLASSFMAAQTCTSCGFPMVARDNSDKGRVAGL